MTSQSAHVLEDAAQDFIHKICAMARMLKDSSHSAASTKVCGHHHLELLGGPTPPTTTCFPSPLTNWCWLCFCGLCLVVTRVALMLGRQWLLPLSGRLCPVGCTASAGATTSEEGGERLGGGGNSVEIRVGDWEGMHLCSCVFCEYCGDGCGWAFSFAQCMVGCLLSAFCYLLFNLLWLHLSCCVLFLSPDTCVMTWMALGSSCCKLRPTSRTQWEM